MQAVWILVAVLVVATVIGVMLRMAPGRRRPIPMPTQFPLWDAEDHQQRDFWPELLTLHRGETIDRPRVEETLLARPDLDGTSSGSIEEPTDSRQLKLE